MRPWFVIVALGALAHPVAADDPNTAPFGGPSYDESVSFFDLHVGAMVVDYDDAKVGGGAIGGSSLRLTAVPNRWLGLAIVADAELGYATELVGQLRGGVGVGVVHEWFSASVFGGGAVGSMGRAAAADLFVGGNVVARAHSSTAVWIEAARAFAEDGMNHDRLELRVMLPERLSDPSWSWTAGARYLAFPTLGDRTGAAVLVTVGVGVGSEHLWVPR